MILMCSNADYQRYPISPGIFSSYFSSSIYMPAHGPSAPNKGISWQQTDGKLLNSCAKLLSDVNTFPDYVKNGALFGSASVSITQVLFFRNSLQWTCVKTPIPVRLFCKCTVKLLSGPLSTFFIFVSFQLIYNADLFIRTGIGPGPQCIWWVLQ